MHYVLLAPDNPFELWWQSFQDFALCAALSRFVAPKVVFLLIADE